MTTTRSLMTQVNIYETINNIKRNISSFVLSVLNTNGKFSSTSVTLAPSASVTPTLPTGNGVVLLHTDSPVQVVLTLANAAGVSTFTVTSFLYLDYEVASLVITNESTSLTANVVVING